MDLDQNITKVRRPGLMQCYHKRMVHYLIRMFGVSEEEASTFVKKVMKEN